MCNFLRKGCCAFFLAGSAVFAFPPALAARAQEASDLQALPGKIDLQESGAIAEGAEASSGVVDEAADAFKEQAQRDLDIVEKPSQKPTFFAPLSTAAPTAAARPSAVPTAAVRPSAAPTLDISNQSIEQDIKTLQQEAHDLDQ